MCRRRLRHAPGAASKSLAESPHSLCAKPNMEIHFNLEDRGKTRLRGEGARESQYFGDPIKPSAPRAKPVYVRALLTPRGKGIALP